MKVKIPIEAGESAEKQGILRLRKTTRFADRPAPLRMTGVGGVVCFLLMWSGLSSATTYYVSSSVGSDSNAGTSSSAAWQTIAHVNGQTFSPGDSILFKRGDVWNESLEPVSSGSSGNPIAFGAYGSGAAPNLTGYYAVPAAAWVHVSGNAWKALLPATYSTVNFCLFGSTWGQKVAAVSSNLTAQWNFYFANGYVYVYSVNSPATYYNGAIVPMALSNVPVINVNGQTWLTFQHLLVNWFDQYGVFVQVNVQNVTSFGVNPSWMGLAPAVLNQKIQALVWKEAVWGAPWGIFWHWNATTEAGELSATEVTNLIADFKASGATIRTNTGLVNWLLSGTQETGTDGNYYYTFPATSMRLDFRPTKNSPVVDAGQNLGAAYELDINGVNQNSYGSGWEIGAHVYEGY